MSGADAGPTRSVLRGRLIGALKVLFALLLLAWVAQGLAWRDMLLWHTADEVLEVEGVIVGDWQSQSIEFRVAPEAPPLAEGWPAELRAARAAGDLPLAIERRDLAQQGSLGYDWRPGMPRVFRGLTLGGFLLALLVIVVGTFFGVTRWWRLLALARCPSSWWNTLRLTFLGLFFNLVFPGLTGGDVPKALLVVREHPERRADALATVVLDRLVGLWALIALAAGVCLAGGERFAPLRLPLAGFLALASLGMVFLLYPGPRRALGLDRLIARLPMAARLQKLERSALVYAAHPFELLGAVAYSLANHVAVITAIYLLGRDLGDTLDYASYFAVVPVANTITAIPISPSGWGVGEALYGQLFVLLGGVAALGVAVSVTYRLVNVALSLVGGLFLLLPGARVSRSEMRRLEQGAEPVAE